MRVRVRAHARAWAWAYTCMRVSESACIFFCTHFLLCLHDCASVRVNSTLVIMTCDKPLSRGHMTLMTCVKIRSCTQMSHLVEVTGSASA